MCKSSMFFKSIALILCVCIFSSFFPETISKVFAENKNVGMIQSEEELQNQLAFDENVYDTIDGQVSEQPEMDTTSPAKVLNEATEYRAANIKTFRMSDGTYQSVMYSRPVHYQDEDTWKEIDNTLSSSDANSTFTTKDMPYTVTFVAKTNGNKLVTYDTGDISVSLTPSYIKNGKAKKLSSKIDQSNVVVSDNYAFYGDVYENADLEYTVEAYRIKENIIVNSKSDTYEYMFILNVDKKDAEVKLENGVINIYKTGEEQPSLYISAPVMTDNNGARSNLVTLSLEQQKKGEYIVIVEANSNWMNEEARCFPVKIDPTIEDYLCEGFDSACSWDGDYGYDYLLFEDDTHAYFMYNPPGVPDNGMVIDSKLSFYLHMPRSMSDASTGYITISAYPVTSSWDSYDIQDGIEPTTGTILDAGVYFADITFSGTEVTLDITSIIKAWHYCEPYYGIMLETQMSNNSMPLSGYIDQTDDICIITSFIIPEGLNDKWSTHSISADERAGTAYIKDINGDFTYVHPDLATTGNLLPIEVSHIYNINNSVHDSYYGKGWTLNVLQTIEELSVYSEEYENGFHYWIHTDSTGLKTYFYEDDSRFCVCESDPTIIYDSFYKIIEYPDGSYIQFDSNGYAEEIYDNQTNSYQIFTYYADYPGKIYSITDGSGKDIMFEYEQEDGEGLLKKIYHVDMPTRYIYYSYYGTTKNLGTITYSDDSYLDLGYNSTKGLTYVDYHTGEYGDYYKGILLNYDSNNRISKAFTTFYNWDTDEEIQNAVIEFEYGTSTVVTYLNSDAANENVYSETIYFDQVGRTVGVVDSEGYFSYGEYASGDLALFNVIERNTTGKVAVENLVFDGDAQYEYNGVWNVYDATSGMVYADVYYEWAQKPELGEYGITVYNETDETDYVFGIQEINAQAGQTYTVSAVLAEHNFTLGDDGAVVGFGYTDSDGVEQVVHGEPNYSGEYERIAYTYTFPEGSSNFYVLLGIYGGYVYGMFDLVQVETGAIASEYNFVRDNTFTYGMTEWTSSGSTAGISGTDGYRTVYVYGTPYGDSLVYQNINLDLEEGTLVSVGGWGKSRAFSNGLFGLRVTFKNTETDDTEEIDILFNTKIVDWQYTNQIIAVPIDCDQITVAYLFSYNNMGAHFRGLSFEIVNLFDETSDGSINEYDEYGRVIKTKYYDGSTCEYEYDEETGMIGYEQITDVMGNITSTSYYYSPNTGFLYWTTTNYDYSGDSNAPVETESHYERDSMGNIISQRSYVVDNEENKYLVEYKRYTYSNNKNVCIKVIDEKNNSTTYTYNILDELLTCTSSENMVTEYVYDDLGYLISVIERTENNSSRKDVDYTYSYGLLYKIDHNGFSYFFEYADNREIENISVGTSTATRNLASYAYDGAFGQISKMTYGNGQYKNYSYDEKGRLCSITFSNKSYYGSAVYEWKYDDRGNVVSTTSNGVTTNYSYDSEGRIKTITDSNGNSVWQRYYSKDNKSEYSYLSGTTDSYYTFEHSYSPNLLQNTTTVTVDEDNEVHVQTQGDVFGRVASQSTYKVNSKSFEISYDYDTFDYNYSSAMYGIMETTRLNKITYNKTVNGNKTQILPELKYTYYNDGNIASIIENNVLKVRYYYDNYDQLIRENNLYLNNGAGYTITYTYNTGGNIVQKKIYPYTTASSLNGISAVDVIHYGYDSNWKDAMTSYDNMTITRDNMGNPVDYCGINMTWGYGNRLTKVSWGASVIWFNYNQNGLRTEKYIGNFTNVIKYFWVDNVLQSESRAGIYEIVYCYDANGALIGFTYETSTTKAFYRYVTNLQGDVIALLDESYDVVAKYTYDTWGQVLSVTDANGTPITSAIHPGYRNPIRYRGYYYDVETEFYYLQSRYYDPYTGRFINADSYISTGQGVLGHNMFAYCGNNPVMGYDPFGHFSWGDFLDIGTTIISGVYSFAVGLGTFSSSLATTGRPGLSIVKGVAKGATTYGAINNAVNAVYYNYISDGESDLTSSSYQDGYINRWKRLDYAKQETNQSTYNLTAWMYYSEYNLHMYGWFMSGWAHEKGVFIFSPLAEKTKSAEIVVGEWDERWFVNAGFVVLGILGM